MTAITDFIDRVFNEQYTSLFGESQLPSQAKEDITLTRQEGDDLIAALTATCIFETAHISTLVVSPDHRNQDLGTSLVQELESLAKERGIQSITLSTKSYQAKDFYLKMGYTIYAQLEDVPRQGITKYHFIKWLSDEATERA